MKGPGGIFVLLVILGAGYAARAWFSNQLVSTLSNAGNTPDCLAVLGSTTSEEDGATYIVGSIRNDCDHAFGNVTISFILDRTPGPLGDLPEGQAFAYGRNLKAGEIQQFKTAIPVARNSTFRFTGIHAF